MSPGRLTVQWLVGAAVASVLTVLGSIAIGMAGRTIPFESLVLMLLVLNVVTGLVGVATAVVLDARRVPAEVEVPVWHWRAVGLPVLKLRPGQ